ncbi:MAG: taurine dioxygenase [Balneolaceae bacterium]|nr:taurine dioxygenase [Balneolaceae bacterium]
MSKDNKYIDREKIGELLYRQENFVREFAEAAELSFKEFEQDYTTYLLKRDETNFRKAGHKIKPIAQMLEIEEIVDEYEHAKRLLWDEAAREKLQESADRIQRICKQIIRELKELR